MGEVNLAISVVVLASRGRKSVTRAIESVFRQTYRPLSVLVLIDNEYAGQSIDAPPERCTIEIVQVPREPQPRGRLQTLKRVAHLRNLALNFVPTPFVAFIDDDNFWESDHLATLFASLTQLKVDAVHCWRRIVGPDGQPARLLNFPWLPVGTPAERAMFDACVNEGVFDPSGSVIRDDAAIALNGTLGMVDMGAWLLRTDILKGFRFPEHFTDEESAGGVGEDDKLLEYLRRIDASIACTRRPTLIYQLGGFSNQPSQQEIRVGNIALSRFDIESRKVKVSAMPRFTLVELSRYCNLSCPMCREPGAVPKSELMSERLFEKIERELFPFAEIIDLRGWGESLILPEFSNRLERAARSGARTRVVTNLSFNRDAVLRQLAEVGTYVGVSLDAADPEILSTVRRGANADLIFKNLRLLGAMYRQRDIVERITIYVTVQRPALADLANLVEVVGKAGIGDVRLAPVTGCDDTVLSIAGYDAQVREAIGDIQRRGAQFGVQVSATARLPGDKSPASMPTPCTHPWTHCYVTWDGRIGFCDHLIGPSADPYIVGALGRQEFHEIWNGPEWMNLRGEHLGQRRATASHFSECSWCYQNRHLDAEDLLEPGVPPRHRINAE